jgi:hypothetical protein
MLETVILLNKCLLVLTADEIKIALSSYTLQCREAKVKVLPCRLDSVQQTLRVSYIIDK